MWADMAVFAVVLDRSNAFLVSSLFRYDSSLADCLVKYDHYMLYLH